MAFKYLRKKRKLATNLFTTEPLWKDVLAVYNFENNTINAKTGASSYSNNPTYHLTPDGVSYAIAGSMDGVFPADIGTDDFSIEIVRKYTTVPAWDRLIKVGWNDTGYSAEYHPGLNQFRLVDGSAYQVISTAIVPLDPLSYFTFKLVRKNGYMSMYVNDAQVGNTVFGNNRLISSHFSLSGESGHVAAMRASKVALDSNPSLPKSDYNYRIPKNKLGLYFDDNLTDSFAAVNWSYANGNPTYVNGRNGKSIQGAGGQWVYTGAAMPLYAITGDFTLRTAIKTPVSTAMQCLAGSNWVGNGGWLLLNNHTTRSVRLFAWSHNNAVPLLESNIALATETEYIIDVVREGDAWSMYVDNVLVATATSSVAINTPFQMINGYKANFNYGLQFTGVTHSVELVMRATTPAERLVYPLGEIY